MRWEILYWIFAVCFSLFMVYGAEAKDNRGNDSLIDDLVIREAVKGDAYDHIDMLLYESQKKQRRNSERGERINRRYQRYINPYDSPREHRRKYDDRRKR